MKRKAKTALGIMLLLWGGIALIAFIQITIEQTTSFSSFIDNLLGLCFIAVLPLFFSYLLLKRYLKRNTLKQIIVGNPVDKAKLEEQLAKYFKPAPVKVPVGRSIAISKEDETLSFQVHEKDKRPLNNSFFIKYKDAQGSVSQRRITVKEIFPSGYEDFYLGGYCHERKAARTFLLSRVQEMVDLETGEVIEDKTAYFFDKYYKMNENPIQQLLEERESEVLVLIFIARADGVLRKKELEVIAEYLVSDLIEDVDREELIKELRKVHCLVQEFKRHIRYINEEKKQGEKAKLLQCINDVILADKKADPLEQAGLETIKKIFKVQVTSTVVA